MALSTATITAQAAPPADWSKIETRTITLFYPGQSTYDWLRTSAHKRAYKKVLRGDSCVSCHEGEEQELGETLITEGRLEPTPIDGKNPTVDLQVQVAYDNDNAYFRFQWKTQMDRAGQMHN